VYKKIAGSFLQVCFEPWFFDNHSPCSVDGYHCGFIRLRRMQYPPTRVRVSAQAILLRLAKTRNIFDAIFSSQSFSSDIHFWIREIERSNAKKRCCYWEYCRLTFGLRTSMMNLTITFSTTGGRGPMQATSWERTT
jgi:hypothetical protein